MKITDVKIKKVESNNRVRALVSITLDDAFVITSIKVLESENGLFLGMPSRKELDGSYKDIAHPVNSDARNYITETVLAEYRKLEN